MNANRTNESGSGERVSSTASEWRVKSSNGVTGGPYRTRASAQKAADRLNKQAPEQGWHPWLYEGEDQS